MQSERGCFARGWLPMQTATQYRKFAEECERLATAAKTERRRDVLMEMAEVWRSLAQEAEKKHAETLR